jgi:hypothetical protein
MYTRFEREVKRFAGENILSLTCNPHWLPMSKEGCQALYDCGVRLISATIGERYEYDNDAAGLPYGHAARLLHNRKPETKIFIRNTKDTAITKSLCGYNHITEAEQEETLFTPGFIRNEEIGILFKNFSCGLVHNLSKLEDIRREAESYTDREYMGWGTHEQYFYPEYYAYQPDYAEKLMVACEVFYQHGYSFIFMEDLIK